MRFHDPRLSNWFREPMAMDFWFWLVLLTATILAFALGPRSLF